MRSTYTRYASLGVIVPIIFIFIFGGSSVALEGMAWYDYLSKPDWTPPEWVFGVSWSIIYVCFGLSAFFFLKDSTKDHYRERIVALYSINAIANFTWSFVFFRYHFIQGAFWHALIILSTLLLLMGVLWKKYKISVALLLPYLLWLFLAVPLALQIVRLNP